MVMEMMKVRGVRMKMFNPLMFMIMGMDNSFHSRIMVMIMMPIFMTVPVLMPGRNMNMTMAMLFGGNQPCPNRHEWQTQQYLESEVLTREWKREGETNKWSCCK